MHTVRTPAEIEYGWIRELRYLPDFARYEAAVVLHLTDGQYQSSDVEIITSVAAHQDEAEEALKQRLVLDAARLLRLSDAGLEDAPDYQIAA